jgi:hypothetical protein
MGSINIESMIKNNRTLQFSKTSTESVVFFRRVLLIGALALHASYFNSCISPDKGLQAKDERVYPLTVYSRYLETPEPADGIEVRTNPPVLRWPLSKEKEVRYDVRLSQSADFEDASSILGIEATSMALFNPHMKLDSGTWYWQYRVSGKAWSDILRFKVDQNAVSLVSPEATRFLEALPAGHPRVLADENDLSGLRSMPASADSRAILEEAEKALAAKFPDESQGIPVRLGGEDAEQSRKLRQDASLLLGNLSYAAIAPLCEAYILTGDQKYSGKAIQNALKVAAFEPGGVSAFSDFGDARCMLSMALVYDTFHQQLSESQRTALLKSIAGRASGFYHSWINNQEARLLSGHVWQHILHYFFQTAMAVYHDVPEAADWLSYAYELFLSRTPVLGGMDGGWVEGVSYFRMNMETLIEIPLYINKYTGFDFYRAHPWYREQIQWMVYHIPPGSAPDGFADNVEEMASPGSDYIAFAQEMAKLCQSPLASWYARECEKYGDRLDHGRRLLRWTRLTGTAGLPMPEPDAQPELPMAQLSHDIGMVAMHTRPGNIANSLGVFLKSGPMGCYGHMLADQNVFNILYGGKKLFYRTGYKVTMQDPHRTGWYQHTKSQNGMLINGQGQPCSTEAYGFIARFMQGGGLAYAKGDASSAYRSAETDEEHGMTKYFRHIVLLDPDVVVIYDELEAEQPSEWSWLIHSHDEMMVDQTNGIFSVKTENALGTGQLWASSPVTWLLTDTFEVPAVNWRNSISAEGVPKTYDAPQWHLKATNTDKARTMRYLSIIRVSPEGVSVGALKSEIIRGEVIVSSGNWTIRAHLDQSIPPGMVIQNTKTGTVFSSHGGKIKTDRSTFKGESPGSSLLGYMAGELPVFVEVEDRFPYVPYDLQRE